MEKDILIEFGTKIRNLRIQKGYSQEKLAELTGFHRTYIGLVENGKRNLSLKNIEIFANCLEIQLSDLFKI